MNVDVEALLARIDVVRGGVLNNPVLMQELSRIEMGINDLVSQHAEALKDRRSEPRDPGERDQKMALDMGLPALGVE